MIEIEVQVVYGSWAPPETFIEKVEKIEKTAHSHENAELLKDFSIDENGRLLYKGKYVTERPTAVFEFEGSSDCFLSPDMPGSYMLTLADYYMDSDIPFGAELKTIEFQFKNNGEWDEEWVDIHFIELVDGAAYALHMDKVIDYEGYKMFATIAFFDNTGFIYDIAHSWQDARIRITYYTDNIGGENNA